MLQYVLAEHMLQALAQPATNILSDSPDSRRLRKLMSSGILHFYLAPAPA